MSELTNYEPEVTSEFTRVLLTPPFGNVVDVGANLGYYSILAAKMLRQTGHFVWAFEPQTHLVSKIYQEAAVCHLENLHVLQMALSDHNGYMDFHLPVAGSEMYGGFYQNGRFETDTTVQVAVRRLDDVDPQFNIGNVRLIKLDAEGAELAILRGASRLLATHPVIIYEANEQNLKPYGYIVNDIRDFLAGFGYQARQLDEENWIAEWN